ncbi:hypothetical protein PGTUg99_020863 [Puccinia graminis f. sp. tritici]|uniref:Uncharacterized protein n=1 Tax=Puccinia graminis f. sp. tritici TaxID=56615 RepID=A0A5B0REF6_PUCGR|nr:hypothetical protein PGTUg99_020863 [Puccinia graminis f. sp. tritici]
MSFAQLDNLPREWERTRSDTKLLFSIATTANMSQFNKKSLALGVKDTLNTRILLDSKANADFKDRIRQMELSSPDRLYNSFLRLEGFDGVKDTPVEVLHVVLLGVVKYLARDFVSDLSEAQKDELIAQLHGFDTTSLNIDSLKPKYLIRHILSLVGKDFKIILQELKLRVNEFLYHLIRSTAQWVNKPKLHMLLHLAESILRFGPAALFSTEKFESYNGVLRKASVHSNKQAPGRDLAVAFDSYSSLKFILSGGSIYDRSNDTGASASLDVTSTFTNNPILQRAMGYNQEAVCPPPRSSYPFADSTQVDPKAVVPVPAAVARVAMQRPHYQRGGLVLSLHDKIRKGSFVVVKSPDELLLVGQVNSIWEVMWPHGSVMMVHVDVFQMGIIDEHYEMRRLERLDQDFTVDAEAIFGSINVQHNCELADCGISNTKVVYKERKECATRVGVVNHIDQRHFLINASSLTNPELHRKISDLPIRDVTPDEWVDCINAGLSAWGHPASDHLA